jgi:hypothetical protein
LPDMPVHRKTPAGFATDGEAQAFRRKLRGFTKSSRAHPQLNVLVEGQRVTHAAVAAAHDEVRGARADIVEFRDALTGRSAHRPDQSPEDCLAEMVIGDAVRVNEKKVMRGAVAANKKRKREAEKAEKAAEKQAEKKKKPAAAANAAKPEKKKKKKMPPTKEQVEKNEAGLSAAFRHGAGVDESNKEAGEAEKEEAETPADVTVETEKPVDALEEAEKPADVTVETEKPADAPDVLVKKHTNDKKDKKTRSFVGRLLFRNDDTPTDSTDVDDGDEEKPDIAQA